MKNAAETRAVWIAWTAGAAVSLGGIPVLLHRAAGMGPAAAVSASLLGAFVSAALVLRALAEALGKTRAGAPLGVVAGCLDFAGALGLMTPTAFVWIGGAGGWMLWGIGALACTVGALMVALRLPPYPWVHRVLLEALRALPAVAVLSVGAGAPPRLVWMGFATSLALFALSQAARPGADEKGWARFVSTLLALGGYGFGVVTNLLGIFAGGN